MFEVGELFLLFQVEMGGHGLNRKGWYGRARQADPRRAL